MLRICTYLFLTAPLLLVIGCGPSGPKTYPVTGKVTIGGNPAPNVNIMFAPKTPDGTLQTAGGSSDDSGNYTLFTGNQGKPGAMAGAYIVTVSESEDEEGAMAGYMSDEGGTQGGADTSADPSTTADSKIPADFSMEVEVKAESNTINIEIPAS